MWRLVWFSCSWWRFWIIGNVIKINQVWHHQRVLPLVNNETIDVNAMFQPNLYTKHHDRLHLVNPADRRVIHTFKFLLNFSCLEQVKFRVKLLSYLLNKTNYLRAQFRYRNQAKTEVIACPFCFLHETICVRSLKSTWIYMDFQHLNGSNFTLPILVTADARLESTSHFRCLMLWIDEVTYCRLKTK